MSDSRISRSPFGIHDFLSWSHPWNSNHYTPARIDQALGLIKEAGAEWVRTDFLWADIEPVRGSFTFDKYDRIVDLILKHGLKILAIVAYSPLWNDGNWNQAPDPVLYTEFATTLARRYKDRIRCWEIWNEPDHQMFWQPQDNMQAYTQLLKTVYPAMKQEDSSCQVHLGGLSRSLPACLDYIYFYGGKDYFDVADLHPYINPLLPNAVTGLRELYEMLYQTMKSQKDENKPIWFTEVGCPGIPEGADIEGWWMGKNPTEAEQAAWVEQVYGEPLTWPGVENVFWCFFRDTQNHFTTGVDYFGLLRPDFSKKPGFHAFRRAADRFKDRLASASK
jgi:hypothetical protein